MAIDKKAFRSLSYGLHIVTAQGESGKAGCVVNTFARGRHFGSRAGEHRHQ